MEHPEGFGGPAADADGATTEQPERNLQPGDPNLTGGAPAEEKKGIAAKVKDMMGRHGRKKHRDATASAEDTDPAAKGGILHKVKAKAGAKVDGSKHGPARLLSMSSSSSSLSSSDEEDIGPVGFAMDPTGPAVAGSALGREDFSSAPEGPGADFRDLHLDGSDDDAYGPEMEQHSERAAEYAKTSNPVNPNYGGARTTPSEDGEPRHSLVTEPSNSRDDHEAELHRSRPTEAEDSNSEGAAMASERHGDLHDGPRGDSVKQE